MQRILGDDFPRAGGQAASRNGSAGNNSNTVEDLGILKALQSMGTAAKRNISNLAERFNSKPSGSSQVMQYGQSVGERGDAREFKPLVSNSAVRVRSWHMMLCVLLCVLLTYFGCQLVHVLQYRHLCPTLCYAVWIAF